MGDVEEGDVAETASVDLAVAFFCSVLVLFVFIAFALDDAPPEAVDQSIGQTVRTERVEVPGWSAVNARGGFAIYAGGQLAVLNMTAIGEGMVDPLLSSAGERGFMLFAPLQEPSPAAFRLRLTLRADAPPEAWLRAALIPGPELSCPDGPRLLTVFVPDGNGDLAPLEAFAARCGIRLRLEPTPTLPEDGFLAQTIGLAAGDYVAESMFR